MKEMPTAAYLKRLNSYSDHNSLLIAWRVKANIGSGPLGFRVGDGLHRAAIAARC